MRRLLTLFMAALLVLTVIPLAQAAPRFSDVPSNHWAYKEITEMAERGIIQGYKDGKFRPNNKVTRAEFAKIMIAAAGVDITKRKMDQTFVDVPRSHWAFSYVEHAKPFLTGYKIGNRYYYKPGEYAVREDIAVALVRLLGYDRSKQADLSELDRFRDENRISPALRSYVAIAVETDLIKGYNGYFRPQDPITRAEAASLLYRAILEREDEGKVVFPNPEPPKAPELPSEVTDSFSHSELKNWLQSEANADWRVSNNKVYARSDDVHAEADHFYLPLRWNEALKPNHYQLEVDVQPEGTDGLGGLYFNGKDGKAYVVFVSKDKVTVGYVNDPNKEGVTVLASANYKLRSSNKLKVEVKGNSYAVYLNGGFLFGQQSMSQLGYDLGLYVQEEAAEDAPDDATYFDNFHFKVLN